MKNIWLTALLLILIMCLTLCGCRTTSRFSESGADDGASEASFADNVTIAGQPAGSASSSQQVASSAAPAESAVPTATPTVAPTIVPTATPSPAATSAVYVAETGALTITKSPTSEAVAEGGKASFVAYANNFASMDWILVSPTLNADGIYQAYTAAEAPNYFSGLAVSGTSSSTLILSNIPASLDGWRVQARFWASGSNTAKYTNAATINVLGATPTPTPTPTPTSAAAAKATEAECKTYADNCRGWINSYASEIGYTVGDVENFTYDSNSGLAKFSVELNNSNYTIEADFFAGNDCDYGYYPAYADVLNPQGARISENIYGSTGDWQFFQSLIDAYAEKTE